MSSRLLHKNCNSGSSASRLSNLVTVIEPMDKHGEQFDLRYTFICCMLRVSSIVLIDCVCLFHPRQRFLTD
jgi:hypothetical protein